MAAKAADAKQSAAATTAAAAPTAAAAAVDDNVERVTLEVGTWLTPTAGATAPTLGDVNLLLVMQVNCPGCVLLAIPEINAVAHDFKEHVLADATATTAPGAGTGTPPVPSLRLLAVSTAFEDLEYNTLDHTKLLLSTGALVGATRTRVLAERKAHGAVDSKHGGAAAGGGSADAVVTMPERFSNAVSVGWDAFGERDPSDVAAITVEARAKLKRLIASDERFAQIPESQVLPALVTDLARMAPRPPRTFELNDCMGTPTWLLFDSQKKVLAKWIGHEPHPSELVARALKFTAAKLAAAAKPAAK